MGNEYRTADADDIAEVEELKQVVRFFSQDVFTEIELDFTAQITRTQKAVLPWRRMAIKRPATLTTVSLFF